MPTSNHPQEPPPTSRQHAYLRGLAERAGETFTPPATKRDASREIKRLKTRLAGMSRDEQWLITRDARRDKRAISQQLAEAATYAPSFREDETIGHGSTARWAHQEHR